MFKRTVSSVLLQLDKIVDQLEVVKQENERVISGNLDVIEDLTIDNDGLIEDNARANRVQKNIYGFTK